MVFAICRVVAPHPRSRHASASSQHLSGTKVSLGARAS